MPTIKFCGASVTGFNSRLGWGSQLSSIDINVVEDIIREGDIFNPPGIGQPCYFTFGAFKFWGILDSWNKQSSTSGLNLYTIHVKDPRELLEGTQIITGAYNGSTLGIPNILNCYGYWEQTLGFGGANSNESGMLWSKVLTAVQGLTNTLGGTVMGGPLRYMGVNYAVDLSRLPVPPPYYRLSGGPTISLLSAIQQICDDGGVSFFVELDPGTILPIIRVYTVSRYAQPPLGTIAQVTNTNWGGTVIRANNGLQMRNEPTTHFIFGDQQQNLYQTDNITPFWGYNIDGTPVENVVTFVPGLGYCNGAWVNAQEIAGVFNDGSQYYFLTEFEMRFALMNDTSSWNAYVVYESFVTNNLKFSRIGPLGLRSALGRPVGVNPRADVLADFLNTLPALGSTINGNAQMKAEKDLRQFVRKIATNWYGKKYWTFLPFVSYYTDPDTLVIKHSQEVSDGGWLPDGETPLGLTSDNTLKFTHPDGRYQALAIYNANAINLERASPVDSVIQEGDTAFYTKISVDRNVFVWPNGVPSVLITVNNPVEVKTTQIAGDFGPMDAIFQQEAGNTWRVTQRLRAFGAANIQVAGPRKSPIAVGIPLRSVISTYGPWYLAGAPGKVIVQQASDLAPWKYGGISFMNTAAFAKVTSAVTFMQVVERGSIELVGMPLTSLGRALIAGGPETTNIEVRLGANRQGLTTSYEFQTFADLHLNRFARDNDRRIQIMGLTQNEIRKVALTALARSQTQAISSLEAVSTMLDRQATWQLTAATPHPVIIGTAVQASGGSIRVSSAMVDPQEGWGGIGIIDNETGVFRNSALASLSAFARPFANNPNSATSIFLPKPRVAPTGITGLTVGKLNPYSSGNNDFEYLLGGDELSGSGVATFLPRQGIDWNNIRSLGWSLPMMAAGWGYKIDGTLIAPNSSPNYAVGPIDFLYDHNRGCWTSHDLIFGHISSALPGNGGSGVLIICDGRTPLNASLTVYNFFGSQVAASSYITVGYFPYTNKWQVISADCASGVSPGTVVTIG